MKKNWKFVKIRVWKSLLSAIIFSVSSFFRKFEYRGGPRGVSATRAAGAIFELIKQWDPALIFLFCHNFASAGLCQSGLATSWKFSTRTRLGLDSRVLSTRESDWTCSFVHSWASAFTRLLKKWRLLAEHFWLLKTSVRARERFNPSFYREISTA